MIFLLIILLGFCLFQRHHQREWLSGERQLGGGLELSFSDVNSNISDGNTASWSNRANIGGPTWKQRPEFQRTPGQFEPLTFHGHQIPLDYETKRSYKGHKLNPNSITNKNPKCEPGCCPSSNTCDHGCVCYGALLGRL